MPQRTRSEAEYGPNGTITHTKTDGSIGQQTPVTVKMSEYTSVMSDYLTPGWPQPLKEDAVVNNPCSMTKSFVRRSGGGHYRAVRIGNPALWSEFAGDGSLTSFLRAKVVIPLLTNGGLIPLSDQKQLTQIRALSSINKAPYAVTEDLATIRQTLKLLRHPFQTLNRVSRRFEIARKGLSAIRKKNYYRTNALASLWLEYRFAFQPAVRAASTILSSLEAGVRKNNPIETAHSSDTRESKGRDYYPSPTAINYHAERSAKTSRTVRSVVQYRTQPPLQEWKRKYGLRISDVPELMWDLFPYSFMVDRLIDVGASVRAFTNFGDPSIVILGGTTSVTTIVEQTISVVKQVHPSYDVTIVPDTDSFRTETYVREVWKPSVLDLFPPFIPEDIVKNATSTADLAALILQRIR